MTMIQMMKEGVMQDGTPEEFCDRLEQTADYFDKYSSFSIHSGLEAHISDTYRQCAEVIRGLCGEIDFLQNFENKNDPRYYFPKNQ